MRIRSFAPFLVGVIVCAACVNLGLWQLRRADFKAGLQAKYDGAVTVQAVQRVTQLHESQRVLLVGQWLAAQTVFLDNRVYQKRAGFEVLTPLRLVDDSGIVMVKRGWVLGTGDRAQLPQVPTPAGNVTVQGMVQLPLTGGFSLGESATEANVGESRVGKNKVWQHIDLKRMGAQVGQPIASVFVVQENAAGDGLIRDWPRPDFGIDMHRGYAFQWFALAALAAALTLWFGRQRYARWLGRQG